MKKTLQDRLDRIDELSKLEDGWLDDEGIAILPGNIKLAKELINYFYDLDIDFFIYPMPDGRISFETNDKIDVEVGDLHPEDGYYYFNLTMYYGENLEKKINTGFGGDLNIALFMLKETISRYNELFGNL